MRCRKHQTRTEIYFYFIFNIVCIVKRNACPSGPLNRVGRVEVWRQVGEKNVFSSFFFSSPVCMAGEDGKEEVREPAP